MNKQRLEIFYDEFNKEVRGRLYSSDGTYITNVAWQDVLASLLNNKDFIKTCSNDSLTVEYKNIVVNITDWKRSSTYHLVSKYIMKTVALQQNKRLQSIENCNKVILLRENRVKSAKGDLLPESVYRAIKEKHERAVLESQEKTKADNLTITPRPKVKRKNKYVKTILTLTAGGLVVWSLSNVFLSNTKAETFDNNSQDYTTKIKIEDTCYPLEKNISKFKIDTALNKLTEEQFEVGLNLEIEHMGNQLNEETYLKYNDCSEDYKVVQTKIKYGDLIEKYAKKCGIDPKIVLGIATQESGVHELGLRSGSNGGLMQIEISYWMGKEITYYDFDDKETYVIKIDENINDVENNILIGCIILQNELKMYNYNILLAIQSYNMGYSNMSKILNETSKAMGINKTDIINDINCLDWLNYTNTVSVGDPNYINNVLSYTGYGYNCYSLTCQRENGDVKTCTTIPLTPTQTKAI